MTETMKAWFTVPGPEGAVLELRESLEHPQIRARGLVVDVADAAGGIQRQLAPPIRFSRTPGGVRTPAPALGEHTDAVLGEIGFEAADCARLRALGVIA